MMFLTIAMEYLALMKEWSLIFDTKLLTGKNSTIEKITRTD